MSSKNFHLKLIVVAVTLIYSGFAKAQDVVASTSPITPASTPSLFSGNTSSGESGMFPLNPRLDVYGGTGNISYGKGDLLVPLFGSADGIFYTDLQGQINSNKGWVSSLGFGGRNTFQTNTIGGAYFFLDRTKSDTEDHGGNHWWVASPGVEVISTQWDGRINGYFPVGSDRELIGVFSGDEVGEPGAVSFDEHTESSNLFSVYEEIGDGADADVGYTFLNLNRLRVHGGAYYFTSKDASDVHGGEVGVEFPINSHTAILVDDTFDNVEHNTAVVSARFTLGALQKTDMSFAANVQERMLDPIRRNFSNFSSSRLAGSSIPVQSSMTESSNSVPVKQNIWFFAPNGSNFIIGNGTNNCTFANPCAGSQFVQSTVDSINSIAPNASLYMAQGSYNALNGSGPLTVDIGQSIFGRTSDFKSRSNPNNVVLSGALNLQSNTSLNDLSVLNTGTPLQSMGIVLNSPTNVTLNDIIVGTINTSQSYPVGIGIMGSNTNLTINNSTINASGGSGGPGFGINAIFDPVTSTSANININDSTFNASSSTTQTRTLSIYGTNSTVVINNGNISSSGVNITVGIDSYNGSTTTLNNSMVTSSAISGSTFGVVNGSGGAGVLTITGSTISASSPTAGAPVSGVQVLNNTPGTTTINNSSITASDINSNTTYGVANSTASTVTISNSNIFANGNISGPPPIYGAFIDGGGNTCKRNGSIVTC